MQQTAKITPEESLRRLEAVRFSRGSARLEGFVLSPEMERLNDRYIVGEITVGELVQQTLARKQGG